MLGGSCPPLGGGTLEPGGGTFGLRAFCNMPKGVEEAVIDFVLSGSDRREGSRGGNEGSVVGSAEGLLRGESSSVSGEVGD
jgi:hypothetical protein